MAALAQQLGQQAVDPLQGALPLADCPSYRFDSAQDLAPTEGRPGMHKTRTRRVVSWNYGPFQALEVVRAKAAEPGSSVRRSSSLAALVPRGGAYAFDLIVQVGLQTFLHGHPLAQVQAQQLAHHWGLKVPLSSLCELKLKFLFYLGRLHQQAAPDLQAYLTQRGSISWLIDGTLEPGTPVFFGVKEAQEDWLLDCWKLATENVQDVTACLKLAASRYGQPGQVRQKLRTILLTQLDKFRVHLVPQPPFGTIGFNGGLFPDVPAGLESSRQREGADQRFMGSPPADFRRTLARSKAPERPPDSVLDGPGQLF